MLRKQKKLIATCAAGLEEIVADEVGQLGGREIVSETGSVKFCGSLETAYRICLWSRCANRVLMALGSCTAEDTEQLYQGTAVINWCEHIAPDGTFAVECALHRSMIRHSHYAELKVKDAIVDQFRELCNRRPSIDVKRPDVRVYVVIEQALATLCIDLSGESLHRRGYRRSGGEAPLKETLAAGLVRLLGWHKALPSNSVLLDPMCGSATLLIEAGMMFADNAPGLGRDYFGFLKWRGHNQRLWETLLAEADERRNRGLIRAWPRIIGYDASRAAVRAALANIHEAGLHGRIHVERCELASLKNPLSSREKTADGMRLLLVNPPYGDRLAAADSVPYLLRCLGRTMCAEFCHWHAGVFVSAKACGEALGIVPANKHRLYNGPIPCVLNLFEVPPVAESVETLPIKKSIRRYLPQEEFANRLQKNMKNMTAWAQREQITCYRVYDADIPAYNLAIDLYGPWVHVQEYAAPGDIEPCKAHQRLDQVIGLICEIMNIPRKYVFIKLRRRQKGMTQYTKISTGGRLLEVHEFGCRFLVNLTDYLDTGLFLDHRLTRRMIQEQTRGKRFLNLFGYTGTATVHAAQGGAISSTTVDLSSVYLSWARCNLALNGFSEDNHALVRANCMEWLKRTHEQFDLIFADPPTFSRSKTAKGVFVVQKDYVDLIMLAMRRLERTGVLIFSTNFRQFSMNKDHLPDFDVADISA